MPLEFAGRRAKRGDYVQVAVHPNGTIYYSEPEDYANTYCLLGPIASQVENLEALPFHSSLLVSLITYPNFYDSVYQHLAPGMDPADLRHRLQEGIDNLEFSLARGHNTTWVINAMHYPKSTAREIMHLARLSRQVLNMQAYTLQDRQLQRSNLAGQDLADRMIAGLKHRLGSATLGINLLQRGE